MIFCMTSLGMICFSSLIQGWYVTKTNIIDRLLLFAATVALMYPELITGFFLPHEQRYLGYVLGVALMVLIWLRQKAGVKLTAPREAAA